MKHATELSEQVTGSLLYVLVYNILSHFQQSVSWDFNEVSNFKDYKTGI